MKFKVGDLIIGTSKYEYGITNSDAVCQVIDDDSCVEDTPDSEDDIVVKVISVRTHGHNIGRKYRVCSDFFEKFDRNTMKGFNFGD